MSTPITKHNNIKEKYILGIKISSTPLNILLKNITRKIDSGSKFNIITPGPEIILMAQKNKELKKALNQATYSIPDGIGLKLAYPKLEIIKGRELFLDLIKLANINNWNVFLLGGLENESLLTENLLKIENCELRIKSVGGKNITTNLSDELIKNINSFSPDLLFIAFSHPEQELFFEKYKKKLNARCIMTVGGTFNYIAGGATLPPVWMAGWGEWFWRLITEPKRIKRIFSATILFPIEVVKERLGF